VALPDSRIDGYRALPCGKYILRILGSEPFADNGREKKLVQGPDEVPYKGRDVAFTVEKGSPTTIDLGDILLQPQTR
jgi:hypothetical protein